MKKNRRFIRAVFSVTGIVFIAKALGFVKQIVVAGTFGATIDTDLISLSEGITVNIEYVIAQTLITAFVPIYIHARSKNEKDASKLVSDSLKTFSILVGILAIIIIILAPFIAKIIAPSYDAELTARLAVYLRLFAPLLVFYTIQAIFHALLNANERFVPGQMLGLNQSVILICLSLLFGRILGVTTLVIGFFAYSIFNVCYLGFFSRKYWSLQKGGLHLSEDIRSLLRMIGPLLLGYAVVFINQQVDKIIVSGMEAGTVTAMSYGSTLSNFVATLIGAFCSILYTHLSEKVASGNHAAASALAVQSVGILVTVFLPITIITVLCSHDIVSIVFERGAFDGTAVSSAAYALAGYGFMFIPYIFKSVFSRLQYGHKNTKLPMINNSIGIGFNIILSLILYKPLGVFGVTLASSLAEAVSGVLNVISAKKLDKTMHLQELIRYFPVWIIGGLLCAAIIMLGSAWLSEFGALSRFIIIVLVCMAGYSVISIPLFIGKIKTILKFKHE